MCKESSDMFILSLCETRFTRTRMQTTNVKLYAIYYHVVSFPMTTNNLEGNYAVTSDIEWPLNKYSATESLPRLSHSLRRSNVDVLSETFDVVWM